MAPVDILASVMTIEVKPQQIGKVLDDTELANGFEDRVLTIYDNKTKKDLEFEIAYDGEGEIIARVICVPADLTESEAEILLRGFFNNGENEEKE